MRENHTQEEQPKSTIKPPSPSNSPSRKRLLDNPNPKQPSTTPSPQSSLSSYSSSDQFRKKTREFPNLSDCHSCGLRINHTNPKDRLQTLDSFWRIVLLCKKCIKRVELAEICPYCFDKTFELDCFKCRDCKKFIHKECVVNYGKFAPWSFCHLDSRFSVCVDCWVPNLLANSLRVYTRRRDRNMNKKVGDDSRVVVKNNGPKLLEDVVKDANFVVEKKIEVVVKAKEDALRKAVVAKSKVEFANGLLGLVAKNNDNGGKSECLDDEELAFQLHRAINSSPRIAKNLCSINSSCLDVRKMRGLCADRELNEKQDRYVSEHSVYDSDHGSCMDLGKECQENGMAKVVVECNSDVDNRLHSVLKSCQIQDELSHEVHSEEYRTQGLVRFGGNTTMLFYRRRNRKCDRYLLKYRKRSMSSKAVSKCEKKSVYDGLRLHDQTSAPGLPLNCSKELRTLSDAPFPSCTVPLQALSCGSGSSREQP